MALKNVLAFTAVRNIEAAIRWYKMLPGREPDTQPMKGLWQFDASGWLQVHENKQMAGRSSVTFAETGVDDRIKQLQRAGIEPKSSMRGEQVTDPDGNQIVFALRVTVKNTEPSTAP